jgi:hypothetical protein
MSAFSMMPTAAAVMTLNAAGIPASPCTPCGVGLQDCVQMYGTCHPSDTRAAHAHEQRSHAHSAHRLMGSSAGPGFGYSLAGMLASWPPPQRQCPAPPPKVDSACKRSEAPRLISATVSEGTQTEATESE